MSLFISLSPARSSACGGTDRRHTGAKQHHRERGDLVRLGQSQLGLDEGFFQWGATTNYGNATSTQTLASGSSAVLVQNTISNLAALTIYNFRVAASNSSGLRFGTNSTFITLSPPLALTLPASGVTAVTAQLNGSVNPNNLATTTAFEWGTTASYGNTTPVVSLAAGTNTSATLAALSGLVPNTTYHFRAVATNSVGVSLGTDTTFTMQGIPPLVATLTPTNITTNSATLNGTVNPTGLVTTAWFEWGTTTNYGNATAAQGLGAGNVSVAVQAALSALLTDTNYHHRLVASNAAGVTYGGDVIVTPTLLLYLYAGESWSYTFHDLPYLYTFILPSGLGAERCTVNLKPGSFSPGSAVLMETFGNSTNESPTSSVVTSGPATNVALYSAGWYPDLQGTVRFTVLTGSMVVASMVFDFTEYVGGGNNNVYGNTVIPTRNPPPPTFGTQYVSSATLQSATVSADINVRNLSSGLFLLLGTTTGYGSTSGVVLLDRDYFVTSLMMASNLAPGTAYHARLMITNSTGTNYGSDLTFTTPVPATIVTQPASSLRSTSAVLNATAYVNFLSTSAYFEWGTTTNYDQVSPVQNLGNPGGQTNVSTSLAGLSPQTTYHCRAVVFSVGITNRGADAAFITTPPPVNSVVTNLATDDVRGAIERGGTVTFACDGVLVLSNTIPIANDVCLDASGHAVTLSGNNTTRIFSVSSGTLLTLTNVTLANGRSTGGGAIYNEGTVVAQDCRFLNNLAIGSAGANGTNGVNGVSSAVLNTSIITQGTPGQKGADGGNALGGAILSYGSVSLWRCYFWSNSASGGAGGAGGGGGRGGWTPFSISPAFGCYGGSGGNGGSGGAASGGAVASFGTLMINSCTFSNSLAYAGYGGQGGPWGWAGNLNPTIGVYPVGGSGGLGGAAAGGNVLATGNTFISNSLFVANSSVGGTGGSGTYPGGTAPSGFGLRPLGIIGAAATGGAIHNRSTNCLIVNSTLNANTVLGGAGGRTYSYGRSANGGDALGGALASDGTVLAVNLTVSGNTASGGLGGIANGTPPDPGTNGNSYGGSIASTGTLQLVNSILNGGTSNNCYGTITDLGHNLSSDATPAWTSGTSLNNTDPLLLPLANNGGPTLTMALRFGSPALNTADCALAPPTDQRGVARPGGPGCDIGAYEGLGLIMANIWRENAATNVVSFLGETGRV